jgi:uncharacterized protein YuzE
MNISYDQQADVLYLRFEDVEEGCDYIEPTPGAILRVDQKTGRIVGCTILAFQERLRKYGKISVPQINGQPLPSELRALIGS